MGGRGRRASLQPVPACEFGLWLMCKNKIWGEWQGHSVEGLAASPVDIGPPNLGTLSGQARKGIPNRACSSCRHECRTGTRVLEPGRWGSGSAPVGLAESQPEPQEQRLRSPGAGGGHRAGAAASYPGSRKAQAGEDGCAGGGGAQAGARWGPRSRTPTPATLALGAGRLAASGAGIVAGPGPRAGPFHQQLSAWPLLSTAPSLAGLRLLCRQLAGGEGGGQCRA